MIGTPTGKKTSVWVLDVDDPAAFASVALTLPRTLKVATGKGYHLYWQVDPARVVRNAQRHPSAGWPFDRLPGAEVRGEGGYVILPPSRHPTGSLYEWADASQAIPAPKWLTDIVTKRDRSPRTDDGQRTLTFNSNAGVDTPLGLKALAAECEIIRTAGNGEQEAALNTAALKIGSFVGSGALDRVTAKQELLAAATAMPSFNPTDPWTQPKLEAKLDRALSDGEKRPRSLAPSSQQIGLPEPSPLSGDLHAVLPCSPDMLPTALRLWLTDVAERMSVPLDMVAVPAVVAAGGLIGRRIGIRPQQHTDWQESANLWGCTVAPPGAKKSPAASEALGPLKALEESAAAANAKAMVEYEVVKRLHKLESDEADSIARKAIRNGGDGFAALRAASIPDAPHERRYLTSDATVEKLGEICLANPQGITVHRDELLSLFGDLEREERASARGFFLSGWNGNESYTFDRIARGTIRIPAVNISLFGTTQPDRLIRYMADSLQRLNDGMVQRLQLLVWPDVTQKYVECDRAALSEPRHAARRFYNDIAALDPQRLGASFEPDSGFGHFPFLRFAPNAQLRFSQWLEGLEYKIRDDELDPSLRAHFAKYRGLVPRLALQCHIAGNSNGPVSIDALQMAMLWGDYLESHARRAYGSLSLDKACAARSIWRRVKRLELPTPFTARDIQRKNWSGLNRKDRVEAGLEALCDANWLASHKIPPGSIGGRPSTIYWRNPLALERQMPGP